MAYVRWSTRCDDGASSDLYIYESTTGGIVCGGCGSPGNPYRASTGEAMVAHVREHIAAGDRVPDVDELVARLRERSELHLG